MASSRRSGRSTACASRQSASARSASSERSWISSRMTVETPSSPGSPSRRRTSRPVVTTSMRVAEETALSSRVRKPTVRPTGSPIRLAMRLAAARAASLRGSSIRMRPRSIGAASSSASGTQVVLPAPGGATSTALGCAPSTASRRGRHSATGRSGMGEFTPRQGREGIPGKNGRRERIRTSGPYVPNVVLYQAELLSEPVRKGAPLASGGALITMPPRPRNRP